MAALKTIIEQGKYTDTECYEAVVDYVDRRSVYSVTAGVSKGEDIAEVMKLRNDSIEDKDDTQSLLVHSVVTFGNKRVPPNNVMKGICEKLATEIGKDRETIVAFHSNYSCHPHIHIVMNAHDYSSKNYYDDKKGSKKLKQIVKAELESRGQKLTRVREDKGRVDY